MKTEEARVRVVSAPLRASLAATLLILTTAMAGRVEADLVSFSDRTSFLAAAGGGLALADFEALSGQTFETLDSGVSPTIPPGVTFSSTGGGPSDLFVAPAGFNGNTAIVTASLFADFFGTPLIADFAPSVTAVGSDVIPFDFGGDTATIAITVREVNGNLSTFDVTPPVGSSGFFGLIASNGESIAQIVYTPPADFTVGVDNFLFGQAPTAVPEPSTLAVAGLSILGLLAYGRRRRAVGNE